MLIVKLLPVIGYSEHPILLTTNHSSENSKKKAAASEDNMLNSAVLFFPIFKNIKETTINYGPPKYKIVD